MRLVRLAALAALSLLAMSNSCKKETASPCPTATLTVAQIPGLKVCISEPVADVGQSHQYVINSMADYAALFPCKPLPVVDFEKYTILAGKIKTANGSRVLTQQVEQNCAGYTYKVQLEAGLTTVVTDVAYYALVPKIPSGAKVYFEASVLE